MARVLITRAQPQADATAERVVALGFDPLVFPLTQTVALDDDVQALGALGGCVDGIIVATSARAVDVLTAAGLGVWAGKQRWAVVGNRAADQLMGLGATLVLPPAHDVAGLIDGLKGSHEPLTYVAGLDRKPTLEVAFPAMRAIPVYEARALGGFSAEARRQLSVEPPSFALVYSGRGAQLLSQAIEDAALQADMKHMRWLCLSEDVAGQAPPYATVHLADTPTQDALLRTLTQTHRD
jgi:uroporphyrinogen-III synthase